MEISTSSNIVTITGHIKSVNDYQLIKNAIDSLKVTHKSIIIEIKDSVSITSSVIGYLNKLVLKDKIDLQTKVKNEKLISLLDDLHLTKVLKVEKV